MAMRPRLIASLLPVLVLPFLALADDQPPVRVRESELSRSPLFVSSLRITIQAIKGRSAPFISSSLDVQIENTSSAFTVFFPHRLSFVDGENRQIDVLAIAHQRGDFAAVDRSIAPGAHVKELYALNGRVHLPARLYYDEKLLAVITD